MLYLSDEDYAAELRAQQTRSITQQQ